MSFHSSKFTATGPVAIYATQISRDRLLTAEEERVLADAIANGDLAARDHLANANLRLIVKIAHDYRGRGLALEDLIGEGNLGLLRATKEFDPARSVRFGNYAAYWIKESIQRALTNTTATIRLPAYMVKLLRTWKKMERHLTHELEHAATFDQIAGNLELSAVRRGLVEHALRSRQLARELVEGDGPDTGPESNPARWPEPEAERLEEQQTLRARMEDRLSESERNVVALRFGFGGDGPLSRRDVAKRLGNTREWVRKIENRATSNLRDRDVDADE